MMISIHDTSALASLAQWLRIDPHRLRRMTGGFYKKQSTSEDALREIPENHRATIASEVAFHTLTLHSRHDSQLDGASKVIFRTEQGRLIESVILRIASGRTS